MPVLAWSLIGLGACLMFIVVSAWRSDPISRPPLVALRWPVAIAAAFLVMGLSLALAVPADAALPGEARSAFSWRPIAAVGFVAVAVWVIVHAGVTWWRTPGYSLLSAFEGSLTILWGRVAVLGSALAGLALSGAGDLADPTLAEAIKAAIPPELVPVFGIAVAWVSIWARRRTLGKQE